MFTFGRFLTRRERVAPSIFRGTVLLLVAAAAAAAVVTLVLRMSLISYVISSDGMDDPIFFCC